MTIDDVAFRVSDALNQAGVPFMLVGGFSSNWEQLDWAYIEGWCQRHGTTARLDEIRRTVPDI